MRKRSQLAISSTISKPKVYGSCSLWRVVCPSGCCCPRFALSVLSPIRYSTPSNGGGSVRSVVAAIAVISPWASHCPDRTIRRVVQYLSLEGRYVPSPFSVPLPGSRINATTNQQKTRKCCAWAQRKYLLNGKSTWYTLRGMHVRPHMCHAPVRFGMWAASRIHRSTSFFRSFSPCSPFKEASHPSLLSYQGAGLFVMEKRGTGDDVPGASIGVTGSPCETEQRSQQQTLFRR